MVLSTKQGEPEMTETEFRISHSKIIQYYQLIEDRLRGICAAMLADDDRNWYDRLDDYGTDALGKLIYQVQMIQKNGQFDFLSDEDIEGLHELRKNRNYWCHECFIGDLPITFKNGNVRRPVHCERLAKDFDEAVRWDEKLAAVFRSIDASKDIRKGMFRGTEDTIVITGVQFYPLIDDKNKH